MKEKKRTIEAITNNLLTTNCISNLTLNHDVEAEDGNATKFVLFYKNGHQDICHNQSFLIGELKDIDTIPTSSALSKAVCQSLGYAAEKMRCDIELQRNLDNNIEYHSIAFGTTGSEISFAYIRLIHNKLDIFANLATPWILWDDEENNNDNITTMPRGLKALQAVILKSHSSRFFPRINKISIPGVSLIYLLGSGAFCSVYAGLYCNHLHSFKMAKFLYETKEEDNALSQLRNEYNILKYFLKDGCPNISKLIDIHGRFIIEDRTVLIDSLKEGLVAAITYQGISHNDLRPENIIVMKSLNGKVIIKVIDWGMASKLGKSYYMQANNATYMHDNLVVVLNDWSEKARKSSSSFPYSLPKVLAVNSHDRASCHYILYVVSKCSSNKGRFNVPWSTVEYKHLPTKRASHLKGFHCDIYWNE